MAAQQGGRSHHHPAPHLGVQLVGEHLPRLPGAPGHIMEYREPLQRTSQASYGPGVGSV